MQHAGIFRRRIAVSLVLLGLISTGLLNAVGTLAAPPPPPFDGTSISLPLGTPGNVYGDGSFGGGWCAPPVTGTSIANQQGAPLALIPQEATACTLSKFQAEAASAGLPARMTFAQVGTSAGGRPWYYAVINDLETAQQQIDYANWQTIRAEELTNPAQAQADLAAFGDNVKIPIFWENNIHGDEEEGDDALMQVIRDLVTTPLGTNEFVDEVLNHVVLIIVPNMNPDGRFIGQRQNGNSYDMNRDFLVQSQPEVQHEVALMQQWLPTGAIDTHGYVNPGLTDGLTKPHNPGIEYDLFLKWNQPRLDANRAAMQGIGENNTHPVNDWCPNGDLASGPDFNCASTRTIAASPTGLVYDDTTGVVTVTTTGLNDLGQGALFELSGGGTAAYSPGGVCTAPNHCTVKDPIPLQSTTFTYQLAPGLGLAPSGGGVVTMRGGPAVAQGWDDWGPFYTQTYQAYFGADSSTSEMCSNNTGGNLPGICRPGGATNGRLGGKLDQYEVFWSSVHYWTPVRNEMMHDQLEIFRRGVTGADRVPCCDGTTREGVSLHDLGFWADQHDWSIPYPTAFVIPFASGNLGVGQRNDLEANNLAQWMLNNGIQVSTTASDYTWGGTTFPAGSYVIWMNQALRGLALTALDAGQDVSNRANQLYAPPGAWSHGTLWGADTVEVPHGDASFAPATTPVTTPNALVGGVRDGTGADSDFYSLTVRGWREYSTISSLLHSGVLGEVAEAPFTSTTGGLSPAGTLLFPNDAATRAALAAAGQAAGVYFERNVGVAKPATTLLVRAPRVAILVNSANPVENFQSFSLKRIFGSDATFLSTVNGAGSIQNAASDPLLNFDVIYNTGQGWPTAANTTARARLNAFFGRGGGYIASGASTNNFSLLTAATTNAGAAAPLVSPLTASNQSAGGGDALWTNVGGAASPTTGGYPGQDHLFIPSNVRWFSTTPSGASVDGRYLADMAGAGGNGPNAGFVAGLWRNRNVNTNNAPILIHGGTTPSGADRPNASRYCAVADDPLGARGDGERMWAWIVQCALWTPTLTSGQSLIGALSPVHAWISLKNSDDVGTKFDVLAELQRNGTTIESGLLRCVNGVGRNPTGIDAVVPWNYVPQVVSRGDVLSLKLSTRIGTNGNDTKCAGHNNAVGLRLYYDSAGQPSRFDATIGSVNYIEYLHSDGNVCKNAESTGVTSRTLDTTAPGGSSSRCKDSAGVNFNGGNPYKPFSTWGAWIVP
jgi:hypothetical protein